MVSNVHSTNTDARRLIRVIGQDQVHKVLKVRERNHFSVLTCLLLGPPDFCVWKVSESQSEPPEFLTRKWQFDKSKTGALSYAVEFHVLSGCKGQRE